MYRQDNIFLSLLKSRHDYFFNIIYGELVDNCHEIVSYCREFCGSTELVRQRCNFLPSYNSSGTFY